MGVESRQTNVYKSIGCVYHSDYRPNTVQLRSGAFFINFLRLVLILAESQAFVRVDAKAAKEQREGLASRIVDNGESKMVKRMSPRFKIVNRAQQWAEVKDVDIYAASLMENPASVLDSNASPVC